MTGKYALYENLAKPSEVLFFNNIYLRLSYILLTHTLNVTNL